MSLIYFLSSAFINCSNDGSHFSITAAMVNEQSPVINRYVNYTQGVDFNLKDGNYYSDRPVGTGLMATPFFILGKMAALLGYRTKFYRPVEELFVTFLPNLAALIGLFFMYRLLTNLGTSQQVTWIILVQMAIGSYYWLESTHLFSHALSMCLLLTGCYLAIATPPDKFDRKSLTILTALLSYAAIVEIQNILFVPLFIAYLALSKKLLFRHLTAGVIARCAAIFSAIYGILIGYNYAAFGELTIKSNKFNPSFQQESSFSSALSGNFLTGVDKLFFNFTNPERVFDISLGIRNEAPGLLWASPILLLIPLGIYHIYKRHREASLFLFAMIAVDIGLVSSHHSPITRHIFTILPILFVIAAFGVECLLALTERSKAKRLAVYLFVCLSMAVGIRRAYHVTTSYWGREIHPFPYIYEMAAYAIFYGGLGVSILAIWAIIKGKRRNSPKGRATLTDLHGIDMIASNHFRKKI